MEKNYPKDFKCIVCEKDIEQIHAENFKPTDDPVQQMYSHGVVERVHCGYGSCLDGNIHILAVCDECINEKTLKGIVLYDGDYMDSSEHVYRPLKKDKVN